MLMNEPESKGKLLADRRLREELEPLPPPQIGRRYSVRAALRYLGKSRMTLYRDVKAGRVRVIRDGGRVFVPGEELLRLSTLSSSFGGE